MNFTDIKTMTYSGNTVTIDGIGIEVGAGLVDVDVVQFHKGRDYCIEEPEMVQVPLTKYEYVLVEYVAKRDEVIEPTLDELKTLKIAEAKQVVDEETPVMVNGVSYIGGYESAQKLDSKRRLVIESSGSEVSYIDADDNIVTLTLAEALEVCIAVANAYELKFYEYKVKKKAVEACTTIGELDEI